MCASTRYHGGALKISTQQSDNEERGANDSSHNHYVEPLPPIRSYTPPNCLLCRGH